MHRIRNGLDPKLFYRDPFPDMPDFDGITVCNEGVFSNPAKDIDEYFPRAVRHLKNDEGRALRRGRARKDARRFRA